MLSGCFLASVLHSVWTSQDPNKKDNFLYETNGSHSLQTPLFSVFVCICFPFKCLTASLINTHSPHPSFFSAIHVDSPPGIPTLTTSYVHGTSSHSLLSSTVDQCLQASVERHPDREALVFVQDGIRKTFAQFYQDVSDFCFWFFYRGLVREVILTTVLHILYPSVVGERKTTLPPLSKVQCVEWGILATS